MSARKKTKGRANSSKATTSRSAVSKATTSKATAPKATASSAVGAKAAAEVKAPKPGTSGRPSRGKPSVKGRRASTVSREQAAEHLRGLLTYLGDDATREGLLETPDRVLRSYEEHFAGYGQDPAEHLARTFTEVEDYDELVLVSDIEVMSHCEHHMVPFVGKAHVAYIPDGRVVGLSKLARVVDVYAKRLQVQEKLTAQIANAISEHLEPQGVAVIMQCQHFCMCYRGVRKPGSWTTTSKLHGVFLTDSAARMELLTLIGMHRSIGGVGA